jgi:hypothetical protein
MSLIVIMPVRTGTDGGVAMVMKVLILGCLAVLAAVAFEHAASVWFTRHLGIEQFENTLVKAEMRPQGEADLWVLTL